MKLKNVLLLGCGTLLSSCSVYMASQKNGTDISDVQTCKTRTCLQTNGAELISQQTNKNDVLTEETYAIKKPTGSTSRAVLHGALDVATLGAWEAVGTPIEGVVNKSEKYSMKVFYQANGEDIKSIQLG